MQQNRSEHHILDYLIRVVAVQHRATKCTLMFIYLFLVCPCAVNAQDESHALRQEATAAMRRAAEFYSTQVASHGGYVYHYRLDLQRRWGEGEATIDQIWVQPPGTPTVGLAYLDAYDATGDPFYLTLVGQVADALCYGQLRSGGWSNCIDFDPQGQRVAQYRGQAKRGKNNSSLDDGQSQTAMRFLIRADQAFGFRNQAVHQAAQSALQSLLAAQFANGGFPQVWTGPVAQQPVMAANFPDYDWRTEGRIKEYWTLYTLNDDVAVHVAEVFIAADEVYDDPAYMSALCKLGDFLILAQLPAPQPAWAQQYNYEMQPVWARKFEPPGVSGHESQKIVALLMRIFEVTEDSKYLKPIPAALDYLEQSTLADGQLARYYELKTNRPLYMLRRGDQYSLTYDDTRLPSHYSWKTRSRAAELRRRYQRVVDGSPKSSDRSRMPRPDAVRQVIADLDAQGRWVTTASEERLVGQTKFRPGERYLSSAEFSRNLSLLAAYVEGQ